MTRNLYPLKVHFFITRCLKQLNKRTGFNIYAAEIRVLYFLKAKGPCFIAELQQLNTWQRLSAFILPKLQATGLIELEKKKYRITFEGSMYLTWYAKLLSQARMDKIPDRTTARKKRR